MKTSYTTTRLLLPILLWLAALVPVAADVYYVPIKGTIDAGLARFVERAVSEANSRNVRYIVVEINTFGGRIDAATQIKDALLSARAPVAVYINRRAISAGALISFACDRIIMAPGSSIGAATAVDQSGEKVSEKVQSFMRSEMRSAAEQNNRNGHIAEAMVDERIAITGLVDSTQLLTLTATEAVKWHMADTVLPSLAATYAMLGINPAEVRAQSISWSEELVRFLTDPIVSSLLLTLGFLGLIFEIKTAGWGIGGTVSLIALTLFFGSNIVADLASVTELLLFGAGIILLLLEAFVIPGFGVTGLLGMGLVAWALFQMLLGDYPTAQDLQHAIIGVVMSIFGIIVAFAVTIRYLPQSRWWNRIALGTSLSKSAGVRSSVNAESLVGSEGIAVSDLRPAGKVAVQERVLDVVTEGGYISRDTPVTIITVVGNRVVVRRSETPQLADETREIQQED